MIYGFMHVYQVHNWNKIVEEQFYRMKKSGLWDKIDKLFIGLVGKEPTRAYEKKVKILYHMNKPELFEAFTLTMLHLYSQGFDGQVFYIHTKGVSRNSPEGFTDWRRMMEHYVIDRHKTCLKELENNDIVGCNWHLGEGFMSASSKHAEGTKVTPHFSGNFWWANTNYIKKLPILYPLKSKYECEFWIGKAEPKVAELWHSGIHHQRKPYPESNYIGKLNTHYFIGKEKINDSNNNQ